MKYFITAFAASFFLFMLIGIITSGFQMGFWTLGVLFSLFFAALVCSLFKLSDRLDAMEKRLKALEDKNKSDSN